MQPSDFSRIRYEHFHVRLTETIPGFRQSWKSLTAARFQH